MSKVCCFGEILIRFSPDMDGPWLEQQALPFYIGGAELNVATALAKWNLPVEYVSAMPDNYLALQFADYLQRIGIDTSYMVYAGNRIGTYYLPQGSDLKNAGVIYDRAYSSFAGLLPGQVDWNKILKDVSWFHFSAISPALNANAAAVCKEALEAASKKNITISVDLNYRSKLWQYGKPPVEVMLGLVQYCHIVMGNIWAAEKMLGIPIKPGLVMEKEFLLQQAEQTSLAIQQQFPACTQVANTFRFDNGNACRYYATLYKNGNFYVSKDYSTEKVVDKVGSGDCFMAGLIYGNYTNRTCQETIDMAAAAAFSKLFIKGDATTDSIEMILPHI